MFERKTANKILATVNRSEMSDPSFGTEKKPIAILKFSIENLDPSLDSTVLNTSQNQYRFNVHEYLTYTMGHSDFNRIFKK
jgi:ribosomal protein S7